MALYDTKNVQEILDRRSSYESITHQENANDEVLKLGLWRGLLFSKLRVHLIKQRTEPLDDRRTFHFQSADS